MSKDVSEKANISENDFTEVKLTHARLEKGLDLKSEVAYHYHSVHNCLYR